ncbi:hypothetical protein ACPPVO_35060 [Dactylosporangium sp. McL0621]|uniref:hypothetical protein n=1 Tax=Dactylosporangium sp. McL0621 TaxID=3415678 RepID=UPI003CF5400C
MTALPDHTSNRTAPHRPTEGPDNATLTGGSVPIAVWRLDNRDDPAAALAPDTRFASRLASRLVLVYTDHGGAIVDFTQDPQFAYATAQARRAYIPFGDTATVADPDAMATVGLIVVSWPPRPAIPTTRGAADLFAACRRIMTADTWLIAAVRSALPGQPGATFAEHAGTLLPASSEAGLAPVLQIVAVPTDGEGDAFLYHATDAEAEAARQRQPARHTGASQHVDLLVFRNTRIPGGSKRTDGLPAHS